MTTTGTKRTHKQEVAIAALLSSPTIADAASAVGISEQTLWRWLQEERFQTAYRNAKKQVLKQSISNLQNVTGDAAKTLQEIMNDTSAPASSRIQAAKTVLEYAYKGFELEELETRIAALEKTLKDDDK